MSRPNFIIFLTDDQGYADLSCIGAPDLRTPHLDRLAARGVRTNLKDEYPRLTAELATAARRWREGIEDRWRSEWVARQNGRTD